MSYIANLFERKTTEDQAVNQPTAKASSLTSTALSYITLPLSYLPESIVGKPVATREEHEKLAIAVKSGNTGKVKAFVEKYHLPALTDFFRKHNTTPLHFTLESDHLEILQIFLDAGIDPNMKDVKHYTALFKAMYKGNIEAFNLLLEKGFDPTSGLINAIDFSGKNKRYFVEQLLAHGANPNFTTKNEVCGSTSTPLCRALGTENPDLAVVELLLDRGAKFTGTFNPLLPQLLSQNLQAIKLALRPEYNLDVNAKITFTKDGKQNEVPLIHIAVETANKQIIQLFLDRGVDLNATTTDGKTALEFVPQTEENLEILKMLLSHQTNTQQSAAVEKAFSALGLKKYLNK